METFRWFLYAACLFSLSVYAYRGYRRFIAPPKPVDPPAIDAADPSSPTAAGPAAALAPPPKDEPAPAPKRYLGFRDPSTLVSEGPDLGSESLVQAVIREELAKKQEGEAGEVAAGAAAPATGRGGLFAGAGGADPATRVSVAAALTGVRLPDDLVPLVGDADQIDPHRVVFVSSSAASAADIGRHLGDELERLGYQVTSETDVVAVATKGSANLRVTLFPDAHNERRDGTRRFPTAPPNSVVVEFAT